MTVATNNSVVITPEARDKYHECLVAIEDARKWATERACEEMAGFGNEDWANVAHDHDKLVHEMELSFHRNVTRMFLTPAGDGELLLMTDIARLSFFWRYESGYHGGLIFHGTHGKHGYATADPNVVGTWSVHT